MRRFISTESHAFDFYDISNEEAEVMEAEAKVLNDEIVTEFKDADRMQDVADSLEDVATVTSQISEATVPETQLVQIAGDMGVAGDTGLDASDIVPATEGYVGRRISTEGIIDKVKEIWAGIKRWLKEIWTKVEKFFYKIFGTIPRLRKAIKALTERVEKVSSDGLIAKGEDNKFELTSGIGNLLVTSNSEFKVCKNGADVKKGLGDSLVMITENLDIKETKDFGERIMDLLDEWDSVKPDNAESKVNETFSDKMKNSAEGALKAIFIKATNPVIENNKATLETNKGNTPLGGGNVFMEINISWSLTSRGGLVIKSPTSFIFEHHRKLLSEGVTVSGKFGKLNLLLLPALGSIRKRIRYQQKGYESKKLPESIQFTTLSTSDCEDLLKVSEEILDELETYYRGSQRKELTKLKDRIEKSCDSLQKNLGNDDDDKNAKAMTPITRQMYKVNTSFTNIATTAPMQVYNRGLQNVRTVMMLVSRSLSKYRKP